MLAGQKARRAECGSSYRCGNPVEGVRVCGGEYSSDSCFLPSVRLRGSEIILACAKHSSSRICLCTTGRQRYPRCRWNHTAAVPYWAVFNAQKHPQRKTDKQRSLTRTARKLRLVHTIPVMYTGEWNAEKRGEIRTRSEVRRTRQQYRTPTVIKNEQ